jgi:hypothetical protein
MQNGTAKSSLIELVAMGISEPYLCNSAMISAILNILVR